jgi:hypothetical protein
MAKDIKDESLFVYCPTCRKQGCCIVEAEGNDLESEEVLYFTCGNRKCEDYGRDLEPSREWWARYYKEEETARAQAEDAEIAQLMKKGGQFDEYEYYRSGEASSEPFPGDDIGIFDGNAPF